MATKPSFENKSNPDMKLYAVYPDYWKDKWGEKPLLGYVRAFDPFYAKRKAYDLNLLPKNITFEAEVVEVSSQNPDTRKKYFKSYKK